MLSHPNAASTISNSVRGAKLVQPRGSPGAQALPRTGGDIQRAEPVVGFDHGTKLARDGHARAGQLASALAPLSAIKGHRHQAGPMATQIAAQIGDLPTSMPGMYGRFAHALCSSPVGRALRIGALVGSLLIGALAPPAHAQVAVAVGETPAAVQVESTAGARSEPLAPAFERGSASNQSEITSCLAYSKSLGENFYACKLEVAFASLSAAARFYGYGTHQPMTATLSAPPPNGQLDLVVALNVSGHDLKSLPNREQLLQERAKDNVYIIAVTHADGRVEEMTGIKAEGALSIAQDISIQNVKPGLLVVEAWPVGSAGVGGYIEGRRLEITVDAAAEHSGR